MNHWTELLPEVELFQRIFNKTEMEKHVSLLGEIARLRALLEKAEAYYIQGEKEITAGAMQLWDEQEINHAKRTWQKDGEEKPDIAYVSIAEYCVKLPIDHQLPPNQATPDGYLANNGVRVIYPNLQSALRKVKLFGGKHEKIKPTKTVKT